MSGPKLLPSNRDSSATWQPNDIAVELPPQDIDCKLLGEFEVQSSTGKAVALGRKDMRVARNPTIGKLKATRNSFLHDLTLEVGLQPLTWGRVKNCTVVYPHPYDTRISRIALRVWWCGSKDYSQLRERSLSERTCPADTRKGKVAIATWAKSGIQVNGTPLAAGQFGYLHTGDKVTIFGNDKERMEFICKFFVGEAKRKRTLGESFRVQEHYWIVAEPSLWMGPRGKNNEEHPQQLQRLQKSHRGG